MKIIGIILAVILLGVPSSKAQNKDVTDIIARSKEKWQWMSEQKIEALQLLVDDRAVFVHMGGTFDKIKELDIIASGAIRYKQVDILEVSVQIIENTAILLNSIDLLAVVGGQEVTNPFVVTEVYVYNDVEWKLAAMSFTKVLTNK